MRFASDSLDPHPRVPVVLALFLLTAGAIQAQLVAHGRQWIPGFEPDQRTGEALAICDFDGDGIDDLAVGMPDTDLGAGTLPDAGLVRVYFGDESGVVGGVFQDLRLSDLRSGVDVAGHRFGAALAAADFDLDGACDLAIGIPGFQVSSFVAAGQVAVVYGQLGDVLDGPSTDYFDQGSLQSEPRTGERFGSLLATGRLSGDPYPDLVVGVPRDRVGRDDLAIGYPLDNVLGVVNAGNVAVLYGALGGLVTSGAQLWNGFTLSTVEPGDEHGFALAVGRLGGERHGPTLAIGVPGREGTGMQARQGGTMLLRGQLGVFTGSFEDGSTSEWSATFPAL